jgi:alpha-mannosidase
MVEKARSVSARACGRATLDAVHERKLLLQMNFCQLAVLLPCHSLEDFPLRQDADQAEQLLSAWSATWHPALLRSAQCVPGWFPADAPPQEPAGHLLILPECSRPLLPEGWAEAAAAAGACLISDLKHRDQMVTAALEQLDDGPGNVDADLAADFLALGFCHFQVELLTRQLRYMSNLDHESFRTEVLAAAEQAWAANPGAARERLQSAFNLLHQAREYFYPVEAHLLDLTLVASTTLGRSLREELSAGVPTNLLICGELVEQMARCEPATLEALREALEKGTAAIIGGESSERALPLLTPEAIRAQLGQGLADYQEHLGRRPTIFGRRRFGLSPVLPQILKELGFVGAVHCTLDDGRFPVGNQSRIRWEGLDGTVLEALARVPIDVGRADVFLRMPQRLGDSMDLDHVATVVLAHWPGQSSPWYRDLKRIASYSRVLGSFTTITDYLERTGMAGQQKQYQPDEYRSPYLKQAVVGGQADPISRWVRYFTRRASVEALQTLDTLATLAAGNPAGPANSSDSLSAEELCDEVESSLVAAADGGNDLDARIRQSLDEAAARFCRSLAGDRPSAERGCLLANPWSFPRRLCLRAPGLEKLPDVGGAVRAAGESAGRKSLVVDLPAMGFAWVAPGTGASPDGQAAETKSRRWKKRPKPELPLAEENVLRNEFFQVTFDPRTGAIRSISDYYSRAARLAQQVALRLPQAGRAQEGDDREYSIMKADELTVTSSGPVLGEIVCRGRLVDRQVRRLAEFRQTTRVWRGSRVIEIEIELDIGQPPGPNPWNAYYAARFAWGDATANLYRSVSLANVPTDTVQLEAPHFIDVRSDKVRTTLLCGGLPYHRRFGLRKLDTLLVVRGETARRFRLGVGIDLPHPMSAAIGFLAPETVRFGPTPPPVPSGWLFHVDARNVLATHWEPLVSEGRVEGVRVRLLETDGRRRQLGLRCFRPVKSAQKLLPGDNPPEELPVEGDRVGVGMRPHEWAQVAARFAVQAP